MFIAENKGSTRIYISGLIGLAISLHFSLLNAASFPLPKNGNYLIGEIQTIQTHAGDTLLDIGRKYDLGFNEIIAANPDVDPWLPGDDTHLILPGQFILPKPPWEGLVINLPEMRLYYFSKAGKNNSPRTVTTHPIGIGQQGKDTPPGKYRVLMKIENPNWTIPQSLYKEMMAEGYEGGRVVPAGAENPLGKYAVKLNNDGLFIHGTNKPFSIGMRVSNGCIRLYPEDMASLVNILPKGTPVRIVNQTYKIGEQDNKLFFEAHRLAPESSQVVTNLTPLVSGIVKASTEKSSQSIDWDYVISIANGYSGIPTPVEKPGGE